MEEMIRVLVTGGAGYIGSVLTESLLFSGYQVTVLDNFMYGVPSLVSQCHHKTFSVVKGDVRDHALVNDLIKKHDVIIALAAIVGFPACKYDPVAANGTNDHAVKNIVFNASKDQLILYPCTNSGYGVGNSDVCTEESPISPLSLYGRTKMEAEKYVLDHWNGYSIRFATVFGPSPRMRTDLMVNDFVLRATRDRALVLFESGFRRNFIHILDAVRVFRHLLVESNREYKLYNAGNSALNMTKMDLAKKISFHVPDLQIFDSESGSDPDKRDYVVSNGRLESTGFRCLSNLDDGITSLIKLYDTMGRSPYGNV
jgi:nucleoside-diphosphate-sugar epimerase